MLGVIAVVTSFALLAFLLHPRLKRFDVWRAASTPLASIIGSGFLVSLPILRDLVGSWAVFPMIGLLTLAYLIGSAIRDNISYVEPLLSAGTASVRTVSIEQLSHFALAFAYFVSVAYYLVLFANFLLKFFGIVDEFSANVIVTVVLIIIGGVGFWRGFRAVEGIEIYAVSLKLAVIAGTIAALGVYAVESFLASTSDFNIVPGHFELDKLPAILGLLILVQGFETSRFLGANYNAEERIRSMKLAQLLSAAIYVAFFLLMIPLMGIATSDHGVAAIVDMLAPVSIALPLLITVGALASQSSAAIADTLGAGGLLNDLSHGRIAIRVTYPLLAVVAGAITWETNVYGLITLASRCFALYYALECLQATFSVSNRGEKLRTAGYALLTAVATAIVIVGAPVEGG